MSIKKREEHLESATLSPPPPSYIYKDFQDFKDRIIKLSLNHLWQFVISENLVIATFKSTNHVLPKFEVFIDNSLTFSLRVYGWMLPQNHQLYSKFNKSFHNVTFTNFAAYVRQFILCKGISTPDPEKLLNCQKHVSPKFFNYHKYLEASFKTNVHQDEFFRSNSCAILFNQNFSTSCSSCHSHCIKMTSEANRKQANLDKPAKLYAPVTHTNPVRLKLALQEHRLQCKQLESELVIMKTALELNSEKVSPELSADFVSLFCGCDQTDVPPFMKLFWEEQQKYVQSSSKSSIRYHPMIIKYCLNLAAKSSSTYSDLRYDSKSGSGILLLPSLRTLRDYKNYIKPTRGFNPAVIKELATKTSSFQPMERFVSIIFDEMKIQEDLVWDKYSGELIGFVDLGDIHTNFATLDDVKQLATHVLVFLVKSIANPLSYSLATFATTGVKSFQIMPIFWKAVLYLEKFDLKVVSCTADGASPNRKFFRMHKALECKAGKDVVYRAKNIHAKENRFMYFFCDVPHLIKTARNCISNSGSGRATRFMWNNGFFILWSHISHLYHDDLESGLKIVNKLTSDHINLTPYSVMRVRLAAQVLSETVGNVLNHFGPPEAAGTAEFCLMMDKFFDCLNVRNTKEHELKKKPNLRPYESPDDIRFEWLDTFLQYFNRWKESIEARNDTNYSANARSNMFISWQTYEGLQITVHSFKEVCKYLLHNGVKFILSERFCQDDLENYFGRQRAIGSRKDNPSVKDVGYNDNTIKSQFSIRPIAGNVHGNGNKFNIIDETPLPKRKKLQQ